jgi:hypothetical protein
MGHGFPGLSSSDSNHSHVFRHLACSFNNNQQRSTFLKTDKLAASSQIGPLIPGSWLFPDPGLGLWYLT